MPKKQSAPVLTLLQQGNPPTGYAHQATSDLYLLRALKFGTPVSPAQFPALRQAALDKGIVLHVLHR